MKTLFTFLTCILFLLSCIQPSCGCDPVPPALPLDGTWKLHKITFGFPAPNTPMFTIVVPEEQITFNTANSNYQIKVAGVLTETGRFSSSRNTTGDILIFSKDNTYSTISYKATPAEISLYQRTPIDAVLADGNTKHYLKL